MKHNNQTKTMLFCLILLVPIVIPSQNKDKDKPLFIRVFSTEGKKIAKGKIVSVNDSLIEIKRNGKIEVLDRSDIGSIKTKRSMGHSTAVGTLTIGTMGAIIGAATSDNDSLGNSTGETVLVSGALGAITGAVLGIISGSSNKSETYIIDGKKENWNNFLERVSVGLSKG